MRNHPTNNDDLRPSPGFFLFKMLPGQIQACKYITGALRNKLSSGTSSDLQIKALSQRVEVFLSWA